MRVLATLVCMATLALAAAPAHAQEVERYQLERTEGGYVRLDTVTGKMSLCAESGGQLVCQPATEEQVTDDNELGSLVARIETLESRVAALEGGAEAGDLPTDEEFEQTLGYMEKFFRRFMGIAMELDRDFGSDESKPDADRT